MAAPNKSRLAMTDFCYKNTLIHPGTQKTKTHAQIISARKVMIFFVSVLWGGISWICLHPIFQTCKVSCSRRPSPLLERALSSFMVLVHEVVETGKKVACA